MSGKVGFWRWLLLKISNGIKSIPKLPKLIKDIDPEFEMVFAPSALLWVLILLVILGLPIIGFLIWGALMFLILAHAFYRMEMEDC